MQGCPRMVRKRAASMDALSRDYTPSQFYRIHTSTNSSLKMRILTRRRLPSSCRPVSHSGTGHVGSAPCCFHPASCSDAIELAESETRYLTLAHYRGRAHAMHALRRFSSVSQLRTLTWNARGAASKVRGSSDEPDHCSRDCSPLACCSCQHDACSLQAGTTMY